jgi:acyl-CoA thioesterase
MPTPIGRVFAVTAVRGHIATGESGGRIAALALAAALAGNELYDFAPASRLHSLRGGFLSQDASFHFRKAEPGANIAARRSRRAPQFQP